LTLDEFCAHMTFSVPPLPPTTRSNIDDGSRAGGAAAVADGSRA
jgi:hypothetical protein